MNNTSVHGDILYNIATTAEINQLTLPTYSNSIASMAVTGDNPYFRLLTPAASGQIVNRDITRFGDAGPIDPSEYSLLSFRMRSSAVSRYSVRWDKSAENGIAITDLAPTFAGWRTYQVNLNSAAIRSGDKPWSTGNNFGLAIYPAFFGNGNTIDIDWMQLTPAAAACPTFNASYQATVGDIVSVFVDENGNTNPNDGYQAREAPALFSGGTTTKTWNSTVVFPGQYGVYGFTSPDFATHSLNPWDFSDSTDLRTTAGVSSAAFTGGKYCGTAASDGAQVYLNIPVDANIDTSLFNKISVGYEGSAGVLRLGWLAEDGTAGGARHITLTGSGTYQIDLSGNNNFPGNIGTWTGTISGARATDHIRIDLVGGVGNFCLNWASLGSVFTNSQPSIPNIVSATGTVTVGQRNIAPLLMPDNAGGVDYFASQRSNPATLDDSADVIRLDNLVSPLLCKGNVYQDNLGVSHTGDYITSANTQTGGTTDGDPQHFAVLRDTIKPIDPTYFKIGCTTIALPNVDVAADHTVLRFGWESQSSGTITGYTGDDIVLRTVGETTYCSRLENMPIEEAGQTVNGNFWVAPLNSFRIDPHERAEATTTILSDIRLAADHEANNKFAVVVGGDRDKAVSLYKNSSASTSGGTLITTLAAARNSDVYLWDTSAETTGSSIYLYSSVDGNKFLAEGPLKINHSTYSDLQSPILLMDAPAPDGSGRYATLDVAGWAADNIRLAAVEVFIGGNLQDRFLPSEFQLDRRNTYSTLPYASKGKFQRTINISALSSGSHTLRVDAYDSAGNLTQYNTTFTKANSSLTAPMTYSTPNETCESLISLVPTAPTPTPTPTPIIRVALTAKLKKPDLTFKISGTSACSQARIQVASDTKFTKNVTTVWSTSTASLLQASSLNISSAKVPTAVLKTTFEKGKPKKVSSTVYFRADCGSGVGTTSNIKIDSKKAGNGKKKVSSVAAWIKKLKNSGKVK